mgnify:CR=1 FL=1
MSEKFIPGNRDQFMKTIDIQSFADFLKEKGISPENEKAQLVRETWNAAVKAACDYFGNQEGTDHGAEKALTIPDPEEK